MAIASLKYKPLDKQEWLRLGVNPPNLEKGVYQMQILQWVNKVRS